MTSALRFNCTIQRAETPPVLRVEGEIDVYTAPQFKHAASELLDEGHSHLLLDLTGVTFMDSSGFGTLLGLTRRLRPLGGGLLLIGPNSTIQRMLKLTRLDTIMAVFPTVDAARASLGTEASGSRDAA